MREEITMESGLKKVYRTPELTVHGSVEEITRQQCMNKTLGGSDGWTFQQQPIHTQCS
jgi:hypothetical protein